MMRDDQSPTFGKQVIGFHSTLEPIVDLPEGVKWINNLELEDTWECFNAFFTSYFSDHGKRLFMFGINPGRFGAGLTGVGFTDPVYLEERCRISNPFSKKHELSSHFIYRMIEAYGTVKDFYNHHYITSMSPLGLTANGKNYNYYDDPVTLKAVQPFIIDCITRQIRFGAITDRAICIGKGKNYQFFSELNQQEGWFDKIIPLPHPRWVMQYNRKDIDRYVDEYLNVLV